MVLILAVRNFREQIFSRSFNFATDIFKYFTRAYLFSRILRISHCLKIFAVTNCHKSGEIVIFQYFCEFAKVFFLFHGYKFSRISRISHFSKISRSQIFAIFRDFSKIAKLNDRENFCSRKFLTVKISTINVFFHSS